MLYTKSPIFIEQFPQLDKHKLKVIELTEDLKIKINNYYHQLLKCNFPFDAMCWALAELELNFEKGKYFKQNEVKIRAKEFFDNIVDYDTICWLIAHFKIYLEEINEYP